jgi:hypothetical protein
MSRHLALVLVPLLAVGALTACGSTPPATPTEERCEHQADKDPNVKAILVNAPAWGSDPTWQHQLAVARHASVNACLSAAGIPQRGGVEPVGTAHYGLGWF